MGKKYTGYVEMESSSWPLRVDVSMNYDEYSGELLLNVEEARELSDTLRALAEDYESRHMVRVKFEGTAREYTYSDPSGSLKAGDRVIVTTGPYNRETEVTVVGIGKGAYDGPVKSVVAKLSRVEL